MGSVGFDGANTKIVHPTALGFDVPQLTIVAWVYARSQGEFSLGRIFQADETNAAAVTNGFGMYHNTTASFIHFRYAFGTTDGEWRFPATDGQWNGIAMSYDRSSTANNPAARVNYAPVTVTTDFTPAGAVVAPLPGYAVGNRTEQDRTWDGFLGGVQFFGRLLQDVEKDAALRRPGSIRNELILDLRLGDANDVRDFGPYGMHPVITSPGSPGPDPPREAWWLDRLGVASSRQTLRRWLMPSAAQLFTQATADTVGLAEILARQISKPLAETLGLTEAMALQAQKVLAETLVLSEGLGTTKVILQGVADTLGLSEAQARLAGKALAEAIGLTEADVLQAQKRLAETLGLSEGLLATKIVFQTFGETLTLGESLALRVGKALGDALALTEAQARLVGKVVGDTLGLTENLQAVLVSAAAVAGAFRLAEIPQRFRLWDVGQRFGLDEREPRFALREPRP